MMPFTWQQYMIWRAPVRALGERGLAADPAPHVRQIPRVGAEPGDRGGQARARPGDARLARGAGASAGGSTSRSAPTRRCIAGARWRSPARACTVRSRTTPTPRQRIFHCDCRRIELARIPIEQSADIAIVGGGESALSCVAFLRAFRPDAQLTIYTPSLPMSRGESFLENRVFSNPDEVAWESLDEQTRRDFVRHCDRGVFDPATLQTIAYDDQCRFVTGRVTHVSSAGGDGGVCVDYDARGGEERASATTTWSTAPGSICWSSCAPCSRRPCEPRSRAGSARCGTARPGREIPIGRNLELEGMRPRLYIPGLGALSQGPGFANLGSSGPARQPCAGAVVQREGQADSRKPQLDNGGRLDAVTLPSGAPRRSPPRTGQESDSLPSGGRGVRI